MKLRFLSLWVAALLAVLAAFIVHLVLRFETVRLGYELDHARKEQVKLEAQKKLLGLERDSLQQLDRVEAIARRTLAMDVVPVASVIVVGGETRRISGRTNERP